MNAVVIFDYGSVPAPVAAAGRQLVDRIHRHEKAVVAEAIAFGNELIAFKERVGHGNFGSWLEAEFPTGVRTAQRYMNAAQAFGTKSDIVSYLPVTTVYTLASPSTPPAARNQIVERIEAGERIDPDEISARLSMARRDEAIRRQEEKKSTAQKKRERRTREQREREDAERRARWEAERKAEQAALAAAAGIIVSRLAAEPARLRDLLDLLATARERSMRSAIEALAKRVLIDAEPVR